VHADIAHHPGRAYTKNSLCQAANQHINSIKKPARKPAPHRIREALPSSTEKNGKEKLDGRPGLKAG